VAKTEGISVENEHKGQAKKKNMYVSIINEIFAKRQKHAMRCTFGF
jgi:hypothetical protein